jgi:cobalt/nickel transport system permease protein
MHIPDGYLGPSTFIFFYIIMVPIWYVASKKVEKGLKTRQIPLLAFGVAFSFVIMMFNFPAPGGTTGHVVGAAILSLTLGPWFGVLGITGALFIQSLLFGDGGITTFAANCWNMAVVMPFVSYYVYRLLSARAPLLSRRRWLSAALSGYVGLNVTALMCAIELGFQTVLYTTADGRPLYAPYPLGITIPAIMIPHLLIFGILEAAATGFLVSYIMRSDGSMLAPVIAKGIPDLTIGSAAIASAESPATSNRSSLRKLWILLGILIVLVPLGVLAHGEAFAEWGVGELEALVGFVPAGLKGLGEIYRAPMANYTLPGITDFTSQSLAYVFAAIIGVSILGLSLFVWYCIRLKAGIEDDS